MTHCVFVSNKIANLSNENAEGGKERVNTLFKLWTIYLWLTSQFTIVQYIYAANLRCMAAQ